MICTIRASATLSCAARFVLDTVSVVSRMHVSALLKIQLHCLPNIDYTHSTHILNSDPFVAQLTQGITPVQHPTMLNPGVAAFSTEEALCQVGFDHSTEIQPNVILLSQKLSLVARKGSSSWGCSRISYSLPVMQHNITWTPGLHCFKIQS